MLTKKLATMHTVQVPYYGYRIECTIPSRYRYRKGCRTGSTWISIYISVAGFGSRSVFWILVNAGVDIARNLKEKKICEYILIIELFLVLLPYIFKGFLLVERNIKNLFETIILQNSKL